MAGWTGMIHGWSANRERCFYFFGVWTWTSGPSGFGKGDWRLGVRGIISWGSVTLLTGRLDTLSLLSIL